MIFTHDLRCKTEPNRLRPVVVTLDDFRAQFSHSTGSLTGFRLRLKVFTDTDKDGTPDDANHPISYWDFENLFYATSGQLPTVESRLKGNGNLMSTIRNFCKNQIVAHNESVAPGQPTGTPADIDTDD